MCTRIPILFPLVDPSTLETTCSPRLWPFLTYPMYRIARYEGDQVIDYRIYAVFSDSTYSYVSPDDLKIGFWKYVDDLVSAVREGHVETITAYAHRIAEHQGEAPVKLRLGAKPWTLRHDGFEEEAEITIREIEVD